MSGERLTEGQGTHTLAVGVEDGFVILRFQRPVSFVKLDPGTATAIGMQMAKDSYKAKFGDDPAEGRRQLTEQLRIRLRNRISLMLRSFSGRAPVPPYEVQATEVVDACMKECA